MKPHGRDCPDRCSLCIGARARQVTNDGPLILIDGQPTDRAIDRTDQIRIHYARRGGKRRRPR